MSQRKPQRRPKRMQQQVSAAAETHTRGAIPISSQEHFESFLAGPQPVIVDFWAPWCGPCKAMAPVFETVAAEFAGQVRFLKVDTEKVPEVAAAFGIRSIPTLIVMIGDEVIDSSVGLTNEATLTRLAQKALDRSEGKTFGQKLKRLFSREQPAA